MKRVLIGLVFLIPLTATASYPTIETKISLRSDQWKDTIAFLAIYWGNQFKVTDTLRFNDDGKAVLKKEFIRGQYEIVFADRSQKSLIINESKLNLKHIKGELSYGRSRENALFYAFMSIQNDIDRKRKILAQDESKTIVLTQKINSLETQRILFTSQRSGLIEKTLAGKIINATCIPNDNGYYENNIAIAKSIGRKIFAQCDISDPNLLFTKVFHERIKLYLTKVVDENSDHLIDELTWILERSKTAEYNYRYLFDYWLGYYQRNKKPTSEIAFDYLVHEYVLADACPWFEEWQKIRLEAQTQFLRNQKLGETPPTLELYDEKGMKLDYESKREKFQMLIFWDPNCAHCKKEVPDFCRIYRNFSDKGFSVVAIYDQLEKDAWLNFINEHNLNWMNGADFKQKGNLKTAIVISETPTVILLNSEGVIINKRFTPEELKAFLMQKLN